MNNTPLEAAEDGLRRAVARGQIDIAAKLIAGYGSLAAEQLQQIGNEDPQYRDTCERVMLFLEWARYMLETHRSGLADELRAARKTTRFLSIPRPDPASLFGVDI